MNYLVAWLQAFVITCGCEVGVAVPVLPLTAPTARRLGAVMVAQLCTHPLIWLLLPHLELPPVAFVALAETWAILVEMGVYRLVFTELSWQRALRVSAWANALSYAVGAVWQSMEISF